MSLAFANSDGAARLRLDEPQWSAVMAAAGTPIELAGALAPLPTQAADSAPGWDATVTSATSLAVGAARVHLDVTTVTGDRGLVARLGSDGAVGACAARVLIVPSSGEPTKLVPGVELSLFRAEDLVSQVMRLVPPDSPLAVDHPAETVALAQTDALVLSEAIRSGDDALARQIAVDQGWADVPDLLAALAQNVRANATIVLRVDGSDTVVFRRWLQSEIGWVGIAIADGTVVHTPCSREDIANELVYALTGAFEVVLAGVDHGG